MLDTGLGGIEPPPPSTLLLLNPLSGEIIPSGSLQYPIQWLAPTAMEKFKLFYSIDNGRNWKPITNDFVLGRSCDWSVPIPAGNKNKCLVKVVGYSLSNERLGQDRSDAPFTIQVVKLDSPNGSERLVSGSTGNTISWTTHGTKSDVAKVILYLTRNGGITWSRIATLIENLGSYDTWTIPGLLKTKNKCKVKVVLKDAVGKTVGTDTSDGYFAIEPATP
jgi:hypothetical protein